MSPRPDSPPDDPVVHRLLEGRLRLEGRFVWGSNFTFLVTVTDEHGDLAAVYKPARGERPLWDFPARSLARREVAAYLVSRALGWDLVPPTVLRGDGPAGAGSLQLFVQADPERHYFSFSEEDRQRLRPAALFDLLINNADRKAGHILLGEAGRVWLIDHGVCFHQEDKLRTVVWDFIGEPIPPDLLEDVERVRDEIAAHGAIDQRLRPLLSRAERQALARRADALLQGGVFPGPGSGRPYPWPLV
jgi:uncharacterized repeat protein (TIGR03843 family)